MTNMFKGARLSTANYDSLLQGWSAQLLKTNVVFDAGFSQYNSAFQSYRDVLTDGYSWNVIDGGVFIP